MSYRRKFLPPPRTREYRKLFVIAVEGDQTEPHYFHFLRNDLDSAVVEVEVIPPNGKSAPQHVLKKLLEYRIQPGLAEKLERWMVIDRDQWPAGNLDQVVKSCRKNKIGLCVSNPAFEFWLLLHFERGDGIEPAEKDSGNRSADECGKRLRAKRYLPGFNTKLSKKHWTVLRKNLKNAIDHAKALDSPSCTDYPRQRIGSTVYRLVESLEAMLGK